MGDSLLNTPKSEFLINVLRKGTHNICICSRRGIYLRKGLSVRCKSIILKQLILDVLVPYFDIAGPANPR
jgi:hypothetical protein